MSALAIHYCSCELNKFSGDEDGDGAEQAGRAIADGANSFRKMSRSAYFLALFFVFFLLQEVLRSSRSSPHANLAVYTRFESLRNRGNETDSIADQSGFATANESLRQLSSRSNFAFPADNH